MTRHPRPVAEREGIVKAEMIVRYRSLKTGRFVKLTRDQLLASLRQRP